MVIDTGIDGSPADLSGKLSAGGHRYCSPGAAKTEPAGSDFDQHPYLGPGMNI